MASSSRVEADVAAVTDLVDGEIKARSSARREVKVGDRKALLCRVDGKYFATGHLCTHYKAPLVKGTLSEDGRIMCPWHGACFNAKTGDVEDAPALDALTSYDVRIEQGRVIVSAEDAALAAAGPLRGSGRRQPTATRHDGRVKEHFVIVGGGPAGMAAVETLREEGFAGKITLISKEPHVPIDRIKLSKSVKVEVEKIYLRDPSYFAANNIDLLLGRTVESVNPAGKNLKLDDGSTVPYTKLLLATGGTPRNFWPSSKGLRNVVVIRSMEDATALEKAIEAKPSPRIIVVGSSFIGMEAASTLVKVASSLVVIGMEKVPFERVLGAQIGTAMQKLHEEKGVKFRMGAVVDEFIANDSKTECVGISLKSGERLDADVVIIGAGVAPTTEFLKGAFPLEKDGSLVTDEFLAVQGAQDVFAAGDIARFPYKYNCGGPAGSLVRIEHWSVAMQQGRIAARNMFRGPKEPFATVPYFWTNMFGKGIRYCGHALSFDDVIIQGDVNSSFIAYYVKGDAVLAVASMARDPAVSQASELMRLGKLPTATEVRNGKSVLDIPIAGELSTAELIKRAAAATATPAAAAPAAGTASSSSSYTTTPPPGWQPPPPDNGFPVLTTLVALLAAALGVYLYFREHH